MVFFEHLYYQLYVFYNKRNRYNEKFTKWYAFLGISFILYINTYSVLLLLHFLGVNILENGLFYFSDTVILISVFLILNYFLFLYKGKGKTIIIKFKNKPSSNERKKKIFIWFYVAFSFILLFILAYFY